MAMSASALTDLGNRFFAYMNARDYASAAELYAAEAVYQSPGLSIAEGLTGRDEIIGYFKEALDGSDFQLLIVNQFTGVNMTVIMSSDGGATFVDVLRVNNDGQIIEHLEVTPQALPNPGSTSC